MIKIDYSNDNIQINTENLSHSFSENELPLKFKIVNLVSKEVLWETNLNNNMWATYPNNELNDVIVEDSKGNFIYRHRWDILTHGSIFYKSLWLYCKNLINQGKKPMGLAIGTHDGEFGEWVPLVLNFMSDILLVEGSEKQFNKLITNYENRQGVTFLNELITPDGKEVEFYEGGKGYTNTIIKRVIDNWETEEIHSTKRSSISITKLLEDRFDKKIDWLHLDVEGLDSQLIMSIPYNLLPDFIIFEDYNLLPDEKTSIHTYLTNLGFILKSDSGICMVSRLK